MELTLSLRTFWIQYRRVKAFKDHPVSFLTVYFRSTQDILYALSVSVSQISGLETNIKIFQKFFPTLILNRIIEHYVHLQSPYEVVFYNQ